MFLIWDLRVFACYDMLEGEVLFLETKVSVGRFALQKLIIEFYHILVSGRSETNFESLTFSEYGRAVEGF